MKRIKRLFTSFPGVSATTLLILLILFGLNSCGISAKVNRLYKFATLFDKNNIVQNFRSMPDFIPHRIIRNKDMPFRFKKAHRELPMNFTYKGKNIDINSFLKETWTTGMVVVKNDQILYEKYFLGNTEDTLCISWSVGKSFVSALVGIAIHEGHIKNVNVIVSDIVPQLKGSGYEGVTLKQVLQMSSGIAFNEDYHSFFSDISRMGRVLALGNSINEFAASLKSEKKPGTFNHYVSMDTQVLGMVLRSATGQNLSQYLETRIWKKIGMESHAKWLTDDNGMELAFGTLNITLRDFARFGRLYLNMGNWNGEQVVPKKWVTGSVTPDAPHLMPGNNPLSDTKMGYGYQWWIPENPRDDFMALGVYGQCIYINPARKMVIVKTSANPEWTIEGGTDDLLIAYFQHLAENL